MTGTLHLIPAPLGPGDTGQVLPAPVLEQVRQLRHFVVEHAKTARAFLKGVDMPVPLQELQLQELNEHTRKEALPALLQPLLEGHDLGLISEAGCPAVADPGADLVALAQARNIRVRPLVGPSSLLLALMASGLNGQRFAFHGYLPAKEDERRQAILQLEKESRRLRQTQLCIETPYRNQALFQALLQHCNPATRLCLATDLTLTSESIRTLSLGEWRRQPPPDFERRPTVFLLLA
ncbi:SAM-dependent methyltransferase [Azovibrio restrictus]|uniref:SAM-dependent methyltransferase n=1 Tax=Azovibrio restrictus TaxID=146938 RepID=UPI0026EF85CF|nr:SAM-dependent methyltransferase [Azovibrio restrictus]MDD3483312.1 SAM-dependent methyltransferase [Azovibrio restrictus]